MIYAFLSGACLKNHHGAKEDAVEKCVGDYLKRTNFLPGGKKYNYKVNPLLYLWSERGFRSQIEYFAREYHINIWIHVVRWA